MLETCECGASTCGASSIRGSGKPRSEADRLLDRERHFACRREASSGIAREPAHDELVRSRIDRRIERARRLDAPFERADERDRLRLAVEEPMAGERFPQDDRRRIDV